MPPNTNFVVKSTLGINPIASRAKGGTLSTGLWLEERKKTDGAEGYWRIHDGIYDLTEFVHKHPGGSEWLTLTKGTDITEAFEVHHLSDFPKDMLKKFFVRQAKTKRNMPFTFEDDGFYRTLRREVQPILKSLPKQSYNNTNFFTDSLLVLTFVLSILAVKMWSFGMGMLAGLFLGMLTVAGHNYFHMKDNIRMYYFQFSTLLVRDWRISHALSHHLYTNTIIDLEIIMFEPILQYLPIKKTPLKKALSVLSAPIVWATLFHSSLIRTWIHMSRKTFKFTDLSWLILPIVIYLFGRKSFLDTFVMWNFIIACGSTYLGFVGLNAGHHHPEVFHDGDTPRSEKYDWGLGQLDALMDRKEVTGSHFLVLTNFGDHALHHFFPTLDHGQLEHLYPTFKNVLKRFNVNLRMVSQIDTIKGSFQQLVRDKANSCPPDLKKYPLEEKEY
ncbi:cytochrome b5-related protein-like [Diorhabda sublineata]|uniref:cytochrome b5-related protein-like n=1 Tax=Diorhabda sublineata TaxID=1163346 RepID=UPI0024E0C44C|nr:cytochrome b5-related protein-like [Diorhabda sublineata]